MICTENLFEPFTIVCYEHHNCQLQSFSSSQASSKGLKKRELWVQFPVICELFLDFFNKMSIFSKILALYLSTIS